MKSLVCYVVVLYVTCLACFVLYVTCLAVGKCFTSIERAIRNCHVCSVTRRSIYFGCERLSPFPFSDTTPSRRRVVLELRCSPRLRPPSRPPPLVSRYPCLHRGAGAPRSRLSARRRLLSSEQQLRRCPIWCQMNVNDSSTASRGTNCCDMVWLVIGTGPGPGTGGG